MKSIFVATIFALFTTSAGAVSACTPGRKEALGLPMDACTKPGTAADALIVLILLAVIASFLCLCAYLASRKP